MRIGAGRAAAAIGVLTTLLAGCSPTALLDTLTPAGDYERVADLAYGAAQRHKLDVYQPRQLGTNRAVVIFLYGGSWRTGERKDYRFVAETLTRRGLVVVIPDYRLYPETSYPGFIDDGAAVVRWVRDHAAEFDGDPKRVFVMGHSAGAYIGTMLALDPQYMARVGLKPRDLAGVIGISGPYDFLPSRLPRVQEIFASAPDLGAAQPVAHATRAAPPMLLLHGTADSTVYLYNSKRLAEKLRAADAPVRLEIYPARGHLDIMLGLSSVFDGDGRLLRDVERFLSTPG